MKKGLLWIIALMLVVGMLAVTGCEAGEAEAPEANNGQENDQDNNDVLPAELKGVYPDGRYRGSFFDSGDYEVAVQFNIEDGKLTSLRYRHLYWRGDDYLNPESEDNAFVFEAEDLTVMAIQHEQLLEYLEGKEVSAIEDLFTPEIAAEDMQGAVDTWSGATIRSAKVISALRDALNRGVYRHP